MRRDQCLFPPDMSERFAKSVAGKSYRPSNGTEGDMFQDRWCRSCDKDDYPEGPGCPIIAASMCFGKDEEGYPPEWIYAENGQPCCTAYSPIQWPPRKEPKP